MKYPIYFFFFASIFSINTSFGDSDNTRTTPKMLSKSIKASPAKTKSPGSNNQKQPLTAHSSTPLATTSTRKSYSLDNAKVINGKLLLKTKNGQYSWAKNGVYKDANGAKISIRNNRISSDTGSHPSGSSFQIIQ